MDLPLYKQIIEKIKVDLESMEPNSSIASERELAEYYGVSRMTARKAVDELVNTGYLYRDTNKGTFVADNKLRKEVESNWVFSSIGSQSKQVVMYYDIKCDDSVIVKLLDMEILDYYIRLVKLNTLDKPISIDEVYVNLKLAKERSLDGREKISKIHEHLDGFVIKQSFKPIVLPLKYASLLKAKSGSLGLQVDSEILTKSGRIFAYIISFVNNENFNVQVTL